MWHTLKLMAVVAKESFTHPKDYSSILTTSDGKITAIRHKGSWDMSINDGKMAVTKLKDGIIEIFQVDGINTQTDALALKQSLEFDDNSMLVRVYPDQVK